MPPRRRAPEALDPRTPRAPATSVELRENEMIALANDLAEKQLREGTASAQVISHYLKLGSSRERLEQQRLAGENELNKIKMGYMASQQRTEELLGDALKAFRSYSGQPDPDDDYEE